MQTKLNIQSRKTLVYHSSISLYSCRKLYFFANNFKSIYISPQFHSYVRMPHLRVSNAGEVTTEKREAQKYIWYLLVCDTEGNHY